jgi:5-methylcytosine-specific restriction enzyme subunit McrC
VLAQKWTEGKRLPCRHFERRINWQLNQVLRAGLNAAAGMTGDRDLRRSVHQVTEAFGDVERKTRLTSRDIESAERGLTRLTAANAPALRIIRLLHEMLGLAFEPFARSSRMPGFLFDMNIFFQRLLSRFLHDNLTSIAVADEASIRNVLTFAPEANPRRRSAPAPKPDFALFRDNTLRGFADAKYRDIWNRGFPADWLYQLSIYALASPIRTSVMLYATMATDARDGLVEVHQPVHGARLASVILRPVPLMRLAHLLDPDRARSLANERRQCAEQLVIPRIRKSAQQRERDGVRAA